MSRALQGIRLLLLLLSLVERRVEGLGSYRWSPTALRLLLDGERMLGLLLRLARLLELGWR